jgi:hypothetical protein
VQGVTTTTPEALADAKRVTTKCPHTGPMRRLAACTSCIALALTEQAQAHEKCIEGIQADQLAMANRENELHDEKDKTLAEQTREIARLKAALAWIAGNYQPTCRFCVPHRDRAFEALARAAAQGGNHG